MRIIREKKYPAWLVELMKKMASDDLFVFKVIDEGRPKNVVFKTYKKII